MLDSRGQVKVLDFGLAKRAAKEELDLASTSVAQTRSGMLIGTPNYMSPEQALGRPVDARTDIFSLGAVLYELITGQRPFLGKTVGETINAVVNKQPEPLGLENPLYSPALDNIVFKCLGKEPEQRYGSSRELANDLAELRSTAERGTQNANLTATIPCRVPEPTCACDTPAPLWKAASQSARLGRAAWRVAGAAAAVLALFALIYFLNLPNRPAGAGNTAQPSHPRPKQSVAVLPFDNYSAEPDSDYLSDGLTEEITTALSRIPGLKVAARNSAFTFKGRREDARKVGETLNVSTVLEGSVRRSGNQVRVTAQLINASNGYHLWSETYNATIDDVFKVQEDIARRIAEKLQGTNSQPTLRAETRDPEAHKLYLQARLFWNKRSEAGLKRAVELFRQAIEKDPTYAAAHAGLAATYLVYPLYSPGATRDTYHPLTKASALRALELDAACAEAHAVLGQLDSGACDSASAERHYRRAIELNPNYATAHHWYGLHLMLNGQREEALKEFQTALDLDPLSPVIHTILAQWYYFGRDYDRAEKEMRNVTTTFPEFVVARHSLVQVLLKKESYTDALSELDKIAELEKGDNLSGLEMRGYALARMGRTNEARGILQQLADAKRAGKPVDGGAFWVHLGLRDYDRAMAALEDTVALKGLGRDLLLDPFLEELQDLPQFRTFLAKHGFLDPPPPKPEMRSAKSG
jgi:TolB-like protein/Tfp pilus assembly protein PilF